MPAPDPLLTQVVCNVIRGVDRPVRAAGEAPRTSDHYVLLHCRTGRARATVAATTHPLSPANLLLVTPGTSFQLGEPSDRSARVTEIVFDARLREVLDMPALYGYPTLHRPVRASMEKITQAARRIVYDIGRARPGWEMAVNSHCLFILSFLLRDMVEHGEARVVDATRRAADLARLSPVLALVEDQYDRPIALREMADVVHLHPAYFATWFRSVTGVSPHQYVARYRVQRAAALLLATNAPLDQVAGTTGHADRSHLTRAFRRLMGATPGQYRKHAVQTSSATMRAFRAGTTL